MNYIHTVLELLSHPENQNFRWNCETWFCVEEFLEEATPQEAQALFEHMKAGRVGFSATYLNFCDLVDSQVLHRRREAQRRYGLARRLEPQLGEKSPALCVEHGEVFTELRLCFRLPGTVKADVLVKFYEALPRVDFRLQLGKTLSSEIESVFLPMSLSLDGGQSLYLKKGGEAFRPGVDQLPGTCMEYSMSDDGLAYVCPQGSALIASYDVPLFYFGEMAHHPIRLCDNREENNRRPVYSWVMNNTWETNFKMDLSGFGEYRYTLWLSGETDPQRAMEELRERCFEPWPLITG